MALTKIKGAGINISATEKLYFDGGGTTYIQESADGVLDFYADNVKMLELLEGATDYVWIPVDATKFAIGAGKDLNIYTSSDDAIIENITSDKDIIFKGNDGGSTITALTLDISAAGAATFNDKIIATELDISGNIDIDGTTNLDVVDIDGAVDMASTLGVTGVVTANAGVVVDNITIDGTEIDLSSGNLTLDVAGSIILNADGGQVQFHDAETEIGVFENSSSDFVMESKVQDKDILFKGNDGGSGITALTLDMSEGGDATFAGKILLNESANTDTGVYFLENGTYKGGIFNDASADSTIIMDGSNANVMHLESGNVAIGISSTSSYNNNADNLVIYETGDDSGITIVADNDRGSNIYFADAEDDNVGGITYNHNSNYMNFRINGSEKMRITSGGDVGIGETSPLTKFYAVETESKAVATFYNTRNPSSSAPYCLDLWFAYTPDNTTSYFVRGQDNLGSSAVTEFAIYSDGSFVQASDRRKKENIVDSENQLDKINQLRVRDYNKINDSSKKKHIGFIAQELQEVFPHLVIEAEDEMKSLQIYKIGIVPLLVKAVQELSAEVEKLKGN